MILYWYNNDIESGQIANGKSAGLPYNDLLWDINDNSLTPINGSFYLRVNTEFYSKYIVKYPQKVYNYPGVYNLKCYYNNAPSSFSIKTVTVIDGKQYNHFETIIYIS
jgi:hypothetical protein